MHHALHPRRSHRLAACTAFALTVGLVTGGPVSTAVAAPAGTTAAAKPRFDLDGDGRSDRIYRSAATGKLSVALSKTGTSAAFTLAADSLEILPADDLTGSDTPEVLTLHPDGTLALHSTVSPTATDGVPWQGRGWHIYNKVLAPGDLTRDGFQDLLARTPDGTLYLYGSKGTLSPYEGGPFRSRVRVGGGWQIYDQLVGTNDIDGDTIADLVAKTPTGDLYFYKGTGSATAPFKPRVRIGGGWNTYNQVIGADDLNGDGRADLLARTHSGTFYRYLSAGGGKFATRTYFGGGGQNLSYYLGQGGLPDHGKHDLFVVDKAGTAFTYRTLAGGRFTAPQQYGAAGDHAYHWETVNGHSLDGVDRSNLLTADNRGMHMWRDGLGHEVSTGSAFLNYLTMIAPGDVTADGESDFIGLGSSGDLFLHPGLKSHSPAYLGAAVKIRTGMTNDILIAAGDVTGDGRPDLVTRHDGIYLHVLPGTGSATAPFGTPIVVGKGWETYAYLASPGDMDGDGRSDLVAVTPSGDVYRYSATGLRGTSTFAPRVKIASGWKYDHIS
ncbi:FG-GAP repeat domain-containing protein [Streptomyces sp. NPDC058326]|uniref:FG-GAP repeat domain-containing protein n=1 Tax=Streptomyces sp. NPDC058326 TaxID=3346447 RepID=UPI0036EC9D46